MKLEDFITALERVEAKWGAPSNVTRLARLAAEARDALEGQFENWPEWCARFDAIRSEVEKEAP